MDLPIEFKKRMQEMLKSEYDAFEDKFVNNDNFVALRINSLKKMPNELKELISGLEKVSWCENGYYVTKEVIDGNSPYHIGGLIYFQEPSAMSVVPLLGIEPGDYVLDLCAAPGGKATYAGEMLKGEGLLVANEIISKRSVVLSDNIERMGIRNAIVTNESPKSLEEKFPEFFNKIIVDAPCSGEGMFRKEPKALSEWSVEHTLSCSTRQKLIMDSAIKMLSPGGRLVYSTCTFAPCENEGVVDYVLSTYPDIELIKIDAPEFSDGVSEYVNSSYDLSGSKRIFPHINKGEGHFIALFEKKGDFIKPEFKDKTKDESNVKIFKEFEKRFLNTDFSGKFVLFGENLYLLPENISIDKLKIVRAGLFLGKVKKGRFEPSHALALALDVSEIKNVFEAQDIDKYLRGETLNGNLDGWCVITYNGVNIGWSKGTGGILKNHFPKYMRI